MALPKERITVFEYERIIAAAENANRRLELINGEIIEKMPTQLHALIVHLINGFLFVFLRGTSGGVGVPRGTLSTTRRPG